MNAQTDNLAQSRLLLLLRAVLAVIVLCLLVLACTPPIDRDGLIHHLQLPKLYLRHGGIYEIPELSFSYYPMNLDLLYMGALHLGSDILPKYIHMAFGLLTALLLHAHLKKRLSAMHAWLGAAFFLSMPIIVKLSITAYVDLGLVFFGTASLLLLLHWATTSGRWRHLLLAGICCGLGLGTKYNGLLLLLLLTAGVPMLFMRSELQARKTAGKAIRATVFFCLAALLTASPWLIKNMLWTGNPIYPLHDGLFNSSKAKENMAEQEESKIKGVFATRHVLYKESLLQLVLLPVRIFFEGQDDDPRYFDGRLNPFLLFLPMMAFFLSSKDTSRKTRLELLTLTVFCLLYFLFAFNTSVLRIRYLVPMVPFLVILSMYGMHSLETLAKSRLQSPRFIILLSCLLAASMMLGNGSYIWQQFAEIDPLSYISGRLSRDEYLTKYRPEYKVMQHANSNLPASSKILCVFMGWRGYYLNIPHAFDQPGNRQGLLAWLQQPQMNAHEIGRLLAKKGMGYLLIKKDVFRQWLQWQDAPAQKLWNELEQRHLKLLAAHAQYALYQTTF